MFTHKGCGGYVFPVQQIEIRCGMTLTVDGIRIAGVGKISKIQPKESKVIISCGRCQAHVSAKEIETRCMQCGDPFLLPDLFVLKDEGGIYCKPCKEMFFSDSTGITADRAMEKTIG